MEMLGAAKGIMDKKEESKLQSSNNGKNGIMPFLDKNIALENVQDSSKKKLPIKEPSSIPFRPLKTREAIL